MVEMKLFGIADLLHSAPNRINYHVYEKFVVGCIYARRYGIH
jgi:hypothetical protein